MRCDVKTEQTDLAISSTKEADLVSQTCIFCFQGMPDELKAKTKMPAHIHSFEDLCPTHRRKFLKEFSKEDKKIAVDIVNTFGKTMSPLAAIFLPFVPFLVEEKHARDAKFLEDEKRIDDGVAAMWKAADSKYEKEEAARARYNEGKAKKPESPPSDDEVQDKEKKRPRAKKTVTPKLSDLAERLKNQMIKEGLSPSELMNRVSGGNLDTVGIQEAPAGNSQDEKRASKKRGRKPKGQA